MLIDTLCMSIHTKNMSDEFNSTTVINTNKSNNFSKALLMIILIVGFITTFASGYFLARMLTSEEYNDTGKTTNTHPTPEPTIYNSQEEQSTTKFLPGKHYFDDTIILITKDKPQINLIASVTRVEQEENYTQATRVSYYDGNSWARKSDSQKTQNTAIVSNSLVKSWNTIIDPSRVLKQTAQGEITINNTSLSFSTGDLQNEIGMRSLPGYTKFMSNGTGTITIDGVMRQVNVLYTRIYSLNAAEIQTYNQSLGLATDWVAFWDIQGNFYHIDSTTVDKPTSIYKSHQIGIMEDANGAVTKTFNVTVSRDSENPPVHYIASLNSPIGMVLEFNRINAINKAPNGSFTWYMGNLEGTVQKTNGEKINGIGLIEYIHN